MNRPRIPYELKRVPLRTTIAPETMAILDAQNEPQGHMIDAWCKFYYSHQSASERLDAFKLIYKGKFPGVDIDAIHKEK